MRLFRSEIDFQHFKFHKVVYRHYSIQMRWKTFTSFCSKFIQETVHQISQEVPEFYRRYYKNILVSFCCK